MRETANRKLDEEQIKKIGGIPESLVSSQFLFHQSRYCSLFAPFPSPPMSSNSDHDILKALTENCRKF